MRNGLRQFLESSTQKKLLWDCRGDTRILLDSFKVKLENVVDIQVLFYEDQILTFCQDFWIF